MPMNETDELYWRSLEESDPRELQSRQRSYDGGFVAAVSVVGAAVAAPVAALVAVRRWIRR